MKLSLRTANHLMWRAGFGSDYGFLQDWVGPEHKSLVNWLFEDARQFRSIHTDWVRPEPNEYKMASRERKEKIRQGSNNSIRQLNVDWLGRMATERGALREKMAVFWHGHFACRPNTPRQAQTYLDTLRKHSLSNFGELLHAVSKEPAMINYLNNRQNRKGSPNENFAREVMELFTLGRDQIYTEDDIKEAARAFTGWTINLNGEFVKRIRQHDFGEKSFLGRRGSFDGEEILDIILEERQTATHITGKLFRYLVNDEPDHEKIEQLSNLFYHSGYDIGLLIREIFEADWFYDQENIGSLVKSPIEYIVGAQKQFHITLGGTRPLLFLQSVLGQQLFFPPNVAGWPGGLNWIDSGTLLMRMNLPKIFMAAGSKQENEDIPKKVRKKLNSLEITINRDQLRNDWKMAFEMGGLEEISKFYLQSGITGGIGELNQSDMFKAIMYLTKLPEYQMC